MNTPNKRPTNHKTEERLFNKGINNTSDNDLQGVINKEAYLDAVNARLSSRNNFASLERIDGEEKVWDIKEEDEGNSKYTCVGSEFVNGNLVSFWASSDWSADNPTPGIVAVNDKITLESANLKLRYNKPLDIAKNENCIGGEIYITDNNDVILYLNIGDMLDNYKKGTQKYFNNFTSGEFGIQLPIAPNMLVFKGLEDTGGASGLPTGKYVYSYRLTSEDGNRTNWSMDTPMIIVPRFDFESKGNEDQTRFKYESSLTGGYGNKENLTRYGVKLAVRIDNEFNYDYLEIQRKDFNNNEGIGYTPTGVIVQKIPIKSGEFSIIEILDSKSSQTDNTPVSADENTNIISIIKRAEAIRYLKNKIILGNVEYGNTELYENIQPTLIKEKNTDKTHYPVMCYLGEKSYKDPVKSCYKSSFFRGEKETLGVVFWDNSFSRTFVVEFDELKNIQMPEKREEMSDVSINGTARINYLENGAVEAEEIGIGSNPISIPDIIGWKLPISKHKEGTLSADLSQEKRTFEVALNGNFKSSVNKLDKKISFKYINDSFMHFIYMKDTSRVPNIHDLKVQGVASAPFKVRTPYGKNNVLKSNILDRDYMGTSMHETRHSPTDDSAKFDPYFTEFQKYETKVNFLHAHYNALGLCIEGIDNIPSWATAFSIVKTKSAGRVVCQGLAMYPLEEKGMTRVEEGLQSFDFEDINSYGINHYQGSGMIFEGTLNNSQSPSTNDSDAHLSKYFTVRQAIKRGKNYIHFHSPDLESGYVPQSFVDNLISDPSRFKLKICEPLGFDSEIYSGTNVNVGRYIESTENTQFGNLGGSSQVDMVTFARVNKTSTYDPNFNTANSYMQEEPQTNSFGGNRKEACTDQNNTMYDKSKLEYDEVSILSASYMQEEEGKWFLEIELDKNIWSHIDFGSDNNGILRRMSWEDKVRLFHEHLYIVNIIDTSAEVSDASIQEYLAPMNYIKLESKVGIISNKNNSSFSFEILGERLEDYHYTKHNYTLSGVIEDAKLKYITIRDVNGKDYLLININEMTAQELLDIDSDIINGTTSFSDFVIHGKYKSTSDSIKIDDSYSFPNGKFINNGDVVIVKYDKRNPINVFCGGVTPGEAMFTYKHRKSRVGGMYRIHNTKYTPVTSDIKDILEGSATIDYQLGRKIMRCKNEDFGTQFKLGFGMPYFEYRLYGNFSFADVIQNGGIMNGKKVLMSKTGREMIDTNAGFLSGTSMATDVTTTFIRQWLINYICESRVNLVTQYTESYPNVNYVERPNNWIEGRSNEEIGIYKEYEEKYPNERARWVFGGFRVKYFDDDDRYNFDYTRENTSSKMFSQKNFLKEDSIRYCTRIVWSQTRPIANFNSPNLKTFRPFNYYDLDDKYGDIRKLAVFVGNSGDNLYAFCENEIALILTDKQTLSSASGEVLAMTGLDDASFIRQHLPMNVGESKGLQLMNKHTFKDIGNAVFFANNNGVFVFDGSKTVAITDTWRDTLMFYIDHYYGKLRGSDNEYIRYECLGYSYYDLQNKEYVFSIGSPVIDIEKYVSSNAIEGANNGLNCEDFRFGVFNFSGTKDGLDSYFNITTHDSDYFEYTIRKTSSEDLSVEIDSNIYGQKSFVLSGKSTVRIFPAGNEIILQAIDENPLDLSQSSFVYCNDENVKNWVSRRTYLFDRVAINGSDKKGLRELDIYNIDSGNKLNGENIPYEVSGSINSQDSFDFDKEFISIQANIKNVSDKKDLLIDIFDSEGNYHSRINGETMKEYGGFWNYIGRNEITEKRLQGNSMRYTIIYNGENKVRLQSINYQFKILK